MTSRCNRCRHWAAYGPPDPRGECTLAELGLAASLHWAAVGVEDAPGSAAFRQAGEVAGHRVRGVLVTDGAFGCVSFARKREDDE